MSGIYAFFNWCYNTNKLILTIGKSKNKKERLKEYRVYNAGTIFHYFKKVPINQLRKEETKLKNFLKKNGHKLFLTAIEQFIVEDKIKTEELLTEYLGKPINKSYKNKSFNVSTLFGNEDIRNLTPMSDFTPGETAMPTTKRGLAEKYRPVYTIMIPNGKGLKELSKLEPKLIDKNSWDTWQCCERTCEYKFANGIGNFKNRKTGPFS